MDKETLEAINENQSEIIELQREIITELKQQRCFLEGIIVQRTELTESDLKIDE